jgi:hypothetical protein
MGEHGMVQRTALGLLASGAVLLLFGAAGLTAGWSVVAGALLLGAASMVLAIALEARDLDHAA